MKTLSCFSFLKPFLPAVLAVLSIAPARSEIQPGAVALAKEVAAKLQSAQTIQLAAKHQVDPALTTGSKLDAGPIQITFKRPNLFFAVQEAKDHTREIAFDGKMLCIMHPGLKHHALEPLKAATIEQVSDAADARFGFRPPLLELLANDLTANLMVNVKDASVVGSERVGWTRCDRLRLVQEGMTTDVWVGKKDKLPYRMLFTYTTLAGQPTWDVRLSKWELNPVVDTSVFSKRPAADSSKVKMIKR